MYFEKKVDNFVFLESAKQSLLKGPHFLFRMSNKYSVVSQSSKSVFRLKASTSGNKVRGIHRIRKSILELWQISKIRSLSNCNYVFVLPFQTINEVA